MHFPVDDPLKKAENHFSQEEVNVPDRDDLRVWQTEAARRASEYINRHIVENSTDCIKVMSLDGRLISMNRQGRCVMEIDDFNSVAGSRWTNFWEGEDNDAARAALQAAQRGATGHFTGYCPTMKGTPKWWDVVVSPLLDSNKKPELIIAISRDITEQKTIERMQSRREREMTLRSDISVALGLKNSLAEFLQSCAEALARNFDSSLTQIWTFDSEEDLPELTAVAGLGIQLADFGRRSPVGEEKIRLIVREKQPYFTDDLQNNSINGDREWATIKGMTAFIGYPLLIENRLLGIAAVFTPSPLDQDARETLATSSETIARAIEQKRADETLAKTERRYRMLSEGIMHHVWTANTDGKIDYINGVALKYFGLPSVEFFNEFLIGAIHPDDVTSCIESWKKSIKTGENYEVEARLRAAEGNYRWFLSRMTAGRDENQKIIKWFGTSTDIDDQKTASAMLGRVRLQLEAALEAGSISTWTYEPATNQVYADKNLARLFSVSPQDAHGGQLEVYLRAIHSEDRERVADEIGESLESGVGSFESEYRIVQNDGSFRWVVARGKIERDATGAPIRMPGAIVDITERKEAEKSLIESQERQRQAQKLEAIGTLTGGVAHDFNNLLTTILVNTQIALQSGSSDDSIHRRLTEIQSAGNRAATLTRQLLAFSRRQHLERSVINLNEIVGETVNLFKRIIGVDINVSATYAPDLAMVFADPTQIEQVVMNLAVNARDAMPRGGKLFIETSNVELDEDYYHLYPHVQPGKYVQIKVEDTGEGIDRETQKQIFEPFFTTKEIGKGTGLGLSIIFGVVNQHEGHISVHSNPGEGATFKVFLPVVEREIGPSSAAGMPSLLGGTETILCAEDEDSLRNVAVDILKLMGYTVLPAKNGAEAVTIFEANRKHIDLILLDLFMPLMSGSETYQRIREMKSDVPIIFMTGYNSETVNTRISEYKHTTEELSSAIIQKPFTIEELGHKVREILDSNKKS